MSFRISLTVWLDFEPTREEETFLQLIRLDKFVTWVITEIMNTSVVQEIILNLNMDTMKSTLLGKRFPIDPQNWKNKMRVVIQQEEH